MAELDAEEFRENICACAHGARYFKGHDRDRYRGSITCSVRLRLGCQL